MNNVEFDENSLALNEGTVRVYDCHPETHALLGSSDEYLLVGVGLPAHSCLEQPPQVKEGFAICRIDGQWQYVVDHRGKTAYVKQTAQEQTVSQLGELDEQFTFVAPETAFDYWDGQGWRTNSEAQLQRLIKTAELKKQQLEAKAEKEIAVLQRGAKLALATEDELKLLAQWERYSVLLSRVNVNHAPELNWPTLPN